jgi:hypothetical protein
MKFRKKPVVIEAVQLRWDNWGEMCDFAGVGKLSDGKPEGVQSEHGDGLIRMAIPTLEGVMMAVQNDWVIRGVKGELYPCKPDIFEATYEAVE